MVKNNHTFQTGFLLLLLLLSCSPAALRAQVSRRDLDGLERHRQSKQDVSVLQSIGDPDKSERRWDTPLIGTWDFLDEPAEEEEEYELKKDFPEPRTLAERLLKLPKDLLIPFTPEVEQQIYTYTVSHANAMRTIIGKYKYYAPKMKKSFAILGIPEELTALCIVESAMNPQALSRTGARGLWQFMPETAAHYGMRCDDFVDQRLDISSSTIAAAKYLKNAYNIFGDWALAISSYNCGTLTVQKAIEKAGTTEFWSIYEYLPNETKAYMPAFIAALYTTVYYDKHNIIPRPYTEKQTNIFRITRDMTFREIIKATNIPLEELVKYNPQYQMYYIPGNDKPYYLRLPTQYARKFKDNIKQA